MRIAFACALGITAVGLTGCDGWPTSIKNQARADISFSYWHDSYNHPSAPFQLQPGQSMLLAREHRLHDLREVRIVEEGREFVVSGPALERLKADCPTYNCRLTYAGDGDLSAMPWTAVDVSGERVQP